MLGPQLPPAYFAPRSWKAATPWWPCPGALPPPESKTIYQSTDSSARKQRRTCRSPEETKAKDSPPRDGYGISIPERPAFVPQRASGDFGRGQTSGLRTGGRSMRKAKQKTGPAGWYSDLKADQKRSTKEERQKARRSRSPTE